MLSGSRTQGLLCQSSRGALWTFHAAPPATLHTRLHPLFFRTVNGRCNRALQPITAASGTQAGTLRTLFPATKPYNHGYLKVSELHEVYYEVYGNPQGKPAVVLHGGPGAGCFSKHSQFFDPSHYRVILLDQRGCGRSRPSGCLVDNTTKHLVQDLEAIRTALLGPHTPWLVFGGSWGTTLAVAYAQAHPERVAGMVLRGVCLMRPKEIEWLFGGGCASVLPMAWHRFLLHLDPLERRAPLLGYYQRLLSGDAAVQQAAARAWSELEMAAGFSREDRLLTWSNAAWSADSYPASGPLPPPPLPSGVPASSGSASTDWALYSNIAGDGDVDVLAWHRELTERAAGWAGGPLATPGTVQALLTCHYCVHSAFLLQQPLLEGTHRLHHIPCIAVQGQADLVCPPATAYDLHLAWPQMELRLVPGATHSMYHPSITHELLQATDRMLALPPSSWAPPKHTSSTSASSTLDPTSPQPAAGPSTATPTPAVPTLTPAVPTPTPAVHTPTPAVPTPTPAVHTPSPASTTSRSSSRLSPKRPPAAAQAEPAISPAPVAKPGPDHPPPTSPRSTRSATQLLSRPKRRR